MNSAVRIVKRKRNEVLKDFEADQREKSGRQSTREIVTTVKGWIAELQQRQRAEGRTWSAIKK